MGGWRNIDDIPMDAESARLELQVVASVLSLNQLLIKAFSIELFALAYFENKPLVFRRIAQTVNRGHGSHDDRVASGENGVHRGGPHHIDFFVHDGVLINISIRLGNIGFRLIEIEVRDEILNAVIGEKFLEFAIELTGQGFIVYQNQSRAIQSGDDIGVGESLPSTSRA